MIPTYMIGGGGKWIFCFDCGRISYHPGDLEHRYCAYCGQFHDDKEMMARIKEHDARRGSGCEPGGDCERKAEWLKPSTK